MQVFDTHSGYAVFLDRANVDTDQIIPKQFLTTITREGLGNYLFDSWRYLDEGYPGKLPESRKQNPDFILNNEQYKNATFLVTRDNFGCGSSREHAVWSLFDYGFRVIIAPSFADIFYNNCMKNSLLPIALDEKNIDDLFVYNETQAKVYCTASLVDLKLQVDQQQYTITIDQAQRERLLKGLDDIGVTLQHRQAIEDFEQQHKKRHPWIFRDIAR